MRDRCEHTGPPARARYGLILGSIWLILALVALPGCSGLLGDDDEDEFTGPWELEEGPRAAGADDARDRSFAGARGPRPCRPWAKDDPHPCAALIGALSICDDCAEATRDECEWHQGPCAVVPGDPSTAHCGVTKTLMADGSVSCMRGCEDGSIVEVTCKERT